MTSVLSDAEVRCSTWSRSVGLDPIGSIGSYDEYLLVETLLPWPRDVGEIPELASLAAQGRRLQALVPQDGSSPEVVLYSRPAGGAFSRYERRAGTLSDSLETLATSAVGAGVDVLVCTHGRRDVCCGSLGTDLALALARRSDGTPSLLGPVRYRRTSHTGGHRFAATFIVLPEGTAWAYADVPLVDRVLTRSVPFSEVSSNYRGCAGLDGPHVQAVERAILETSGWELLDRERAGFLTGESAGVGGTGSVVRFEAGTDRWEAVVSPGRTMPVPDCMRPLSEAKKSETEWLVSELRPVS